MKLDDSLKVNIGITLIALSALVSSSLLMMNKDSGIEHDYAIDEISLFEHRFSGLKNILPPHITIVGYITDWQPDKAIEKNYMVGHYSQYNLTEYVLSPIVLKDGTTYPYVIGNFHKPVDISRISQDNHLILIKELDQGVMLFRSEKVK